jgi:hypothetical protein
MREPPLESNDKENFNEKRALVRSPVSHRKVDRFTIIKTVPVDQGVNEPVNDDWANENDEVPQTKFALPARRVRSAIGHRPVKKEPNIAPINDTVEDIQETPPEQPKRITRSAIGHRPAHKRPTITPMPIVDTVEDMPLERPKRITRSAIGHRAVTFNQTKEIASARDPPRVRSASEKRVAFTKAAPEAAPDSDDYNEDDYIYDNPPRVGGRPAKRRPDTSSRTRILVGPFLPQRLSAFTSIFDRKHIVHTSVMCFQNLVTFGAFVCRACRIIEHINDCGPMAKHNFQEKIE